MSDEFTARQRAITLRLAGRPVKHICRAWAAPKPGSTSGGAATSSWAPMAYST